MKDHEKINRLKMHMELMKEGMNSPDSQVAKRSEQKLRKAEEELASELSK